MFISNNHDKLYIGKTTNIDSMVMESMKMESHKNMGAIIREHISGDVYLAILIGASIVVGDFILRNLPF